jgi:hypothetical protein
MSFGVLAMRLRLALLRHQLPIEAERLLSDADYAVQVWGLCVEVGDPALIALAERLLPTQVAPVPPAIEASPPDVADAGSNDEPAPPRERRYLRGAR